MSSPSPDKSPERATSSEAAADRSVTTPRKKGLHRRLYDWMISFADTRYALPALFLFAFAESSFFPIPPDVLLIMLVLGKPKSAKAVALTCSIASIVGGLAGYGIGHFFWSIQGVQDFFYDYIPGFTHSNFERVRSLYMDWGFWIVFTAGFTPLPYKIITITAGWAGINLPVFLLASTISRSARFFLVAGLVARFGPRAKDFIDRRFNQLSVLFVILLLGGFFAIKYALPHDKTSPHENDPGQKQEQPRDSNK